MKILLVNKFLYPNGGSETYLFGLGRSLAQLGHEVEYFGMEHAGRIVGNRAEAYTSEMDFHGSSKLQKLSYPLKTIYSAEARRKIRLVLDDFQPDVVHLNNFNYQLTPSILLEIDAWRKKTGHPCRILYTAHDYNLLCPNHMLMNPVSGSLCEKCLGGHYTNCLRGKCIHGSAAQSLIGAVEGWYWRRRKVYRLIDCVICCSDFMKRKMDADPIFRGRTVMMHNFLEMEAPDTPAAPAAKTSPAPAGSPAAPAGSPAVPDVPGEPGAPARYALYFGRLSDEKGFRTLLRAVKLLQGRLPDFRLIVAGTGPLQEELEKAIESAPIEYRGFLTGAALYDLIRSAVCSIYPSEWYENCPYSVMESQMLGTPVIASEIGGLPELVRDVRRQEDGGLADVRQTDGQAGGRSSAADTGNGLLFAPGDAGALADALEKLWTDNALLQKCREGCAATRYDSAEAYCGKLLKLYR